MSGKVAMNGIGRATLKVAVEQPELELVSVNEIGSLDNMVYLSWYDNEWGFTSQMIEVALQQLGLDAPQKCEPEMQRGAADATSASGQWPARRP